MVRDFRDAEVPHPNGAFLATLGRDSAPLRSWDLPTTNEFIKKEKAGHSIIGRCTPLQSRFLRLNVLVLRLAYYGPFVSWALANDQQLTTA